jgi:ElaB/YqjD/DUF883 family membrane-anchored ribosome-binding protein
VTDTAKIKPDAEAPAGFNAIVDDIATLRRDFTALIGQMKSSPLKSANDVAEHTVSELSDRVSHLYDSVATQGQRSAKAIGKQVEEQPMMSVLIAFGIGFLASRLLSR